MSKFATAIEAVVVLSGITFVAVITAIMFGFFVPWLVAVMPHAVRPYLIWFENEPGALWLAGGVAILAQMHKMSEKYVISTKCI